MDFYQFLYPGSIATEYLQRLKDPGPRGDSDYDLMLDIIDRRSASKSIQELIPDEHTLVIHLRTGDVIDRSYRSINVSHILEDSTISRYYRPLSYYLNIWNEIQREDIRIDRILLITGWHHDARKGSGTIGHVLGFFGVNTERGETRYKSVECINAVIRFMEDLVDRVDIRLNKDPDEDVLIMANSKYFIKSGGGFRAMIGSLVTKNGGRTFDGGWNWNETV